MDDPLIGFPDELAYPPVPYTSLSQAELVALGMGVSRAPALADSDDGSDDDDEAANDDEEIEDD
jgi:hypothetical protein